MTQVTVPPQREFYNPILQALHNLGGSGTNQEIYDEVVKIMGFTDAQLNVLIGSGTNNRKTTLVINYLSWARTELKQYGLVENPRRAFWALTTKGWKTKRVDPRDVQRTMTQMSKEKKEQKEKARQQIKPPPQPEAVAAPTLLEEQEPLAAEEVIASLLGWRDELSGILHGMPSAAFERLFLHLFRLDGIREVDVTGRSDDDMIEGMMSSGGFLSLRVSFRCIRGNKLISTGEIDDFRREVEVGRAHKGVLVTTGKFTQEARREISRSSAPQIDLIDGEQLIDKLKELSLGVKTERVVVERVKVDADWFQGI